MLALPGYRIISGVRPLHFGADAASILQQIYQRNQVWIAAVVLGGQEHGLRACVTSFHTHPTDVEGVIEEPEQAKG